MLDVRTLRMRAGMTQDECADELGVSRQTWIRYERNPERMTIGQAAAVCSILGTTLETQLDGCRGEVNADVRES